MGGGSYYKKPKLEQTSRSTTLTPAVPAGGRTNQVLAKKSNTSYDTKWEDAKNLPGVGGEGTVNNYISTGVSEEDAIVYAIALGG